jgi:hypothetical protein
VLTLEETKADTPSFEAVTILDLVVDHAGHNKSINNTSIRNAIVFNEAMKHRNIKAETIMKYKLSTTIDNSSTILKEPLLLFDNMRGVKELDRLTSVQVLRADHPDAASVQTIRLNVHGD